VHGFAEVVVTVVVVVLDKHEAVPAQVVPAVQDVVGALAQYILVVS
jgi:hypothetical protein